jgi:hypothetical protein
VIVTNVSRSSRLTSWVRGWVLWSCSGRTGPGPLLCMGRGWLWLVGRGFTKTYIKLTEMGNTGRLEDWLDWLINMQLLNNRIGTRKINRKAKKIKGD